MSDDELSLRIVGVDQGDEVAGARQLKLRTTRGEIPIIVHAAETAGGAMLCISGAIGGLRRTRKNFTCGSGRICRRAESRWCGSTTRCPASSQMRTICAAPLEISSPRAETCRRITRSASNRRVDPRLIRNLLELGGSLWLVLLC